jgi:uncharacterized membrane protein
MSFRVAQDHKVADRDMTLLKPSSTQREDPSATMHRRSCSLLSLAVVLILVSLVMNYIVVKLVLLVVNLFCLMICVMNYIVVNLFCLS